MLPMTSRALHRIVPSVFVGSAPRTTRPRADSASCNSRRDMGFPFSLKISTTAGISTDGLGLSEMRVRTEDDSVEPMSASAAVTTLSASGRIIACGRITVDTGRSRSTLVASVILRYPSSISISCRRFAIRSRALVSRSLMMSILRLWTTHSTTQFKIEPEKVLTLASYALSGHNMDSNVLNGARRCPDADSQIRQRPPR